MVTHVVVCSSAMQIDSVGNLSLSPAGSSHKHDTSSELSKTMRTLRSVLLFLLVLASSSTTIAEQTGVALHDEDQRSASLPLCSLCGAEAMPQAKLDMVLLDRMVITDGEENDETSVTTCADLELFEVTGSEEGAGESCINLQEQYAHACCTPDFDDFAELEMMDLEAAVPDEEPAYIRGHRDLAWTASTGRTSYASTTRTGHNNGYVRPQTSSYQRQTSSSRSIWCRDNPYASNSVRFATPGGACKCPVCSDGRTPARAQGGSFYVPGKGRYQGQTCTQLNGIGLAGRLTNGFCKPFQRANSVCCRSNPYGGNLNSWNFRGGGRE